MALLDRHNDHEIVWDMIHAAAGSVANIAIYPLQDVLSNSAAQRAHEPGPAAATGNWDLACRPRRDLKPEFAARLCAITEMCDRDGYSEAHRGRVRWQPYRLRRSPHPRRRHPLGAPLHTPNRVN